MTEERKAQLYKAWDELSRRQLSNSENLGRAILSLSIAGLALSLAFIRDVVEINETTDVRCLHWSWWAFASAIGTTLFSYHTSQWGLKKQFSQIRNALTDKENPKLDCQERVLFFITTGLGYASQLCYLAAIVLTVIFIKANIGGTIMSANKTSSKPLQDHDPKVRVPFQDNIDERGAPRVEILPELPPNTGTGSDSLNSNVNIGSDAPQSNTDTGSEPNTGSPPSEQESSQSSDK